MAGHNPHGRLGQPLNPSWNHLQVPSFIPRQPQLAHMSNERPIIGAPLNWHTPPVHSAEAIYGYMAAAAAASAASANHKGPPLDLNPLLPAFARTPNNMPFGSVDLSITSSSRNSLTPSPRGGLPSPAAASTPSSNKQHEPHSFQNNNSKSPAPRESINSINSMSASQNACPNQMNPTDHLPPLGSMGNGSILPAALLTMLAAKSQAMATTPPPASVVSDLPSVKSNSGCGLFVRDAHQINSDVSKLSNAMNSAEATGPKEFSDPMELLKGINYINTKHSLDSHHGNNQVSSEAPPSIHHLMGLSPQGLPQNLSELSKSLLSLINNGGVPGSLPLGLPTPMGLQPPPHPLGLMAKSPISESNGSGRIRSSPRKNPPMTSTDDSLDGICNGNGNTLRKSRFRRRKPKKTQRLSSEHSAASPAGSDNMDIDDSIVKSLDETEIESNNARRSAEQLGSEVSRSSQPSFPSKPLSVPNDTNCLNFEDIIPLSKTKIPQPAGMNGVGKKEKHPVQKPIQVKEVKSVINEVEKADRKPTAEDAQKSLDYTKNHLDKTKRSPEDDCDIEKIAEVVPKTASGTEPVPLVHIPSIRKGESEKQTPKEDQNSGQEETSILEEEKPLLPYAEAKIPNTSSPIPTSEAKEVSYEEMESSLEKMFAGVEEEYKSFETSLSPTKKDVTNAKNNGQSESSKQEPVDKEGDESKEGKSDGAKEKSNKSKDGGKASSSNGSNTTSSNNGQQRKKKSTGRKTGKKNSSGANGKFNKSKRGAVNKGNDKKRGRPAVKNNGNTEKNAKVKEEAAVAAEALNKFRGPYVQIERDGSETVINAPITEEIAEKQSKLKKVFAGHNVSDRSKIRGLHVSTLSHKYDAATTDKSWMCVFCKLGPHKYTLGDLFGPYILTTTGEDYLLSQIDPNEDVFKSRRTKADMIQSRGMTIVLAKGHSITMNGEGSKITKGRKRKMTDSEPLSAASTSTAPTTPPMPDIYHGMTKAMDESYEVWAHEDCVVWSSGVHVIGTQIIGLEAAVWSSTRHKCHVCSEYGAMLSCLHRGCHEEAHLPCARRSNWTLSETDFKSTCGKHTTETNIE